MIYYRCNGGGGSITGIDGDLVCLGSGTYFDLTSLFPNEYQNFTADNFLVVPTTNIRAHYNCGNGTTTDKTVNITKTYSDGILSIGDVSADAYYGSATDRWIYGDTNPVIYLIKEVSNLTLLGNSESLSYNSSLSIDIKILYPDTYTEYTVDDFIVSQYAIKLHQYNVGDGPTAQYSVGITKVYTDGVLTISGLSAGASADRFSNCTFLCNVYLIDKKVKRTDLNVQDGTLKVCDYGTAFECSSSHNGKFELLRVSSSGTLTVNGISVTPMRMSSKYGGVTHYVYSGIVKVGDVLAGSAASYQRLLL